MTTLIKNGLVYSGDGTPPVKTDILLNDEFVAHLGNFSKEHAEVFVDATGALVMPGFIDVGNDADHYLSLIHTPELQHLLRQGVTTVIGGNCGASLAPLLTGSLRSIQKWGDLRSVNVNWRGVAEFLKMLEKRGVGVNFGTLVGHSTIRRELTAEEFRDLTDSEIEILKRMVDQAIQEGAFGFSTGLSYMHARRTSHYEINELVKVVAARGGVYSTHLRNAEGNLAESIEETLAAAKATNVNVHISHLQPLKDFAEPYAHALRSIEAAAAESHVHFGVYPFDMTALPIYALLPEWMQDGGLEIMLMHLSAENIDSRLLEHFLKFTAQDIIIGHIINPSLKGLEGKTLKEFAESRGILLNEALLQLMRITRLQAVLFYRNVDTKALETFLAHPNAIVTSDSAGLLVNQGVFTTYLKHMTQKNGMPFEQALSKCSSLPAKKFRLKRRGLLKENYFADVVVLHNWVPAHVFVNGIHAINDGVPTGTLAGHVLRFTN